MGPVALLWMGVSAAASGYSMEIVPESPQAGDTVWYRVAWTNGEAADRRVPVDLLDRVSASYDHRAPWKLSPLTARSAAIRPPEGELINASEVDWLVLQPGQAIERVGDLGELVPECKDGCPPGEFNIGVKVEPPGIRRSADDQVDPGYALFKLKFRVESSRIPMNRAHGLVATIERATVVDKAGTLQIDVKVANEGRRPVWVPASKDGVITECALRVTRGGVDSVLDQRIGIGGQGPMHETSATLLGPGQATTWTLTCDVDLPRKADAVMLSARVRPLSEFYPLGRVSSPFYLAGELVTPETKLP